MADQITFSSSCLTVRPQSFEKQGFHAGTPAASFSLPSALGSGGPINPPAAAGYAPAPFMHILAPHQQPHSQILHHHLQQDGQVVYRLFLLLLLTCFHSCASVQMVQTLKKLLWSGASGKVSVLDTCYGLLQSDPVYLNWQLLKSCENLRQYCVWAILFSHNEGNTAERAQTGTFVFSAGSVHFFIRHQCCSGKTTAPDRMCTGLLGEANLQSLSLVRLLLLD